MKKLSLFMLMAVGLLISGNVGAQKVAKIGTQEYATLKDAVDAVQTGETIVLIDNFESTSTSTTAITIDKEGISFTLDLNGQHITGGKGTTSYGTMRIENGDITIMDSQTGGYIGKSGADKVPVCIIGGSVTLNSGTINGYQYGVNNGSAGTFTMNGGSINVSYTSHAYGVYTFGKVTINGGSISATNTGTSSSAKAYAVLGSTSAAPFINIYGGYFHSSAKKATDDVENATFIGGGKFVRGCVCPDGYEIKEIVETVGSITYTKQVVPITSSTAVAEVGSTQYNSFLEALAKAPNNSTIRLLDNVTLSQYLFFPNETTLTLDLNNKTLEFKNCLGTTTNSYGRIQVGGNLTITDNSLAQNGSIISKESTSTEYCVLVLAGGSLTLEGGTIDVETTGKSAGIYAITNNGNVLMTGGTLKGKNTSADFAGNVLMLNTASADGSAIITGGNIHIKVPTDAPLTSSYSFNFAKRIDVRGGVFTREGASVKLDSDLFGTESSITGGQFNFDPSAYVPVGDKMVTTNGTTKVTPFVDEQTLAYAVVTNPNPIMRVENINTSIRYTSPQEAINAANEGEELQLLETIDLGQASLVFSKGVIFDLNGKMLQSSSASTIQIQGGTETYPVTIVDKADVKGKIIGQKCIQLVNVASHVIVRDAVIEASSKNLESFCFTDEAGDSYVSLERVKGTLTSSLDKPNSSSAIVGSRKNTTITLKDCDFLINYPNAVSTTSSTTVHSIIYTNNKNFTIIIDGGTYCTNVISAKANILSFCSGGYPATILGGKFSINATNPDANTVIAFYGSGGANDKLLIKGGYFTMNPQTWVASTHGVVTSDNPNYQHKVVEQDAASVAGDIYGSVQEAVDAVTANPSLGAITLLRDVTIQNTLELPACITFAATDYTMTFSSSPAIILQSGATLPTCLSAPMLVSAQKSGKTYYYADFYDGYASHSSIKLETNVFYDKALAWNDNGTKTIDLNGYNLTGNQSYSLIDVGYNKNYSILKLINTASQESVVENVNTSEDAHVINISSYGVSQIAAGSYAKVTIGENVKIKGKDGVYIWEEGSSLDVYGSIESEGFAIAGNGSQQNWGTTIHIYEGANIKSTGDAAIYHPQDGTLTIDGGTIEGYLSGIEIRAGELNMTGGTITCTYDSNFDSAPNGSGTTTVGAAIAVAQHTTKQPVNVNISGGTLKGLYALVQINPQDNSAADYAKVKVDISGGKFESTNTQSGSVVLYNSNGTESTSMSFSETDMLLSQNKRIFLTGGYYGKDNGRDPYPFVMPGYVSVLLSSITNPTTEDNKAIDEGYIYKVTTIASYGDEKEARDNGTNWSEDASTLWASTEGGSDGTVPTNVTQVTIGVGKEVIVNTPANAYGIGISQDEQGTTKLTVKDGGMLMIGAGGVDNEKVERFVVEAGGMMAIAPTATEQNVKATVEVEVLAGFKNDYASQQELNADNLYWEHIACPTIGERTLTLVDPESKATGMIVNTWDIVKAWTTASRDDIKTPFVGYNTTNNGVNNSPATYEAGKKVKYVFEGMTVGNKVDPFVFKRDGYTFFGNSYLAPIDIYELLNTLASNDENLEITVAIYNPINNGYDYINRASYIMSDITEIKPLQGFFLHSYGATSTTLDYTKAVWNAFCAKAFTPVQAPRQKECPFEAVAQVNIASESGNDHVVLIQDGSFTDQFENGSDAEKMDVKGSQIYANGLDRNLSIVATDNLIGQTLSMQTSNDLTYTLSFSKVNGENLALMDTQTGETIKMTEGNSYTFVAQPNTTLDGRFVVVAAPAAPTQMDKINKKAQVKGIYSIMGQYIGSEQLWNNLPSGVYMINGTKIVK